MDKELIMEGGVVTEEGLRKENKQKKALTLDEQIMKAQHTYILDLLKILKHEVNGLENLSAGELTLIELHKKTIDHLVDKRNK